MSRENLEIVREIYAAWEGGDYSSTHWAHPEIQYVVADGPAPGQWTGVAGMAEGSRAMLAAWQGFGAAVDEYRELDDERVLVLNHFVGRGRTSGADLGQMRARGANVFHVRGGTVVKLIQYWDRERALADLDISD